ncbi:MAG: histidine kinase dimerization/phospho-acceptor domain-containing protein, partial [Bacteroidota bacterium]
MDEMLLIGISFIYLMVLFFIAFWGERRAYLGRSVVNNPYIYALSLTVYCTAWTYYGSVGRAETSGLNFLTIYLGPTLVMPLWWLVMRKIILICRKKHITSIADFITARYGNSNSLGVLVTLICLLGVTPYIALQLKAISSSFLLLTAGRENLSLVDVKASGLFDDTAFYVTLFMALFTILFGSRSVEATERHEGLVTAIAFESLIKLIAFILVGIYVVYFVFNGMGDIFTRAAAIPEAQHYFVLPEESGYQQWCTMLIISMMAFLFLPRQFQVSVIENVNLEHLKKATWLFPLYLFLINLFVLPLAIGGKLLFAQGGVDADTYVLAIPLYFKQDFLAIVGYIGGFSAATSMIIFSTTALSVMLSNNLIIPILLKIPLLKKRYTNQLGSIVMYIRRLSILIILHLAYAYYRGLVGNYSLVSIGLVSFVAIAQFAPAMLGAIYWRRANYQGTFWGMLVGTLIWFYTLVLPSFLPEGSQNSFLMSQGPGGLAWLRPQSLLGLSQLDHLSHAVFWSLFFNFLVFVIFAYRRAPRSEEINQAEIFLNIGRYASPEDGVIYKKASAQIGELKQLLQHFLGEKRTEQILKTYARQTNQELPENALADARLVDYAEKLLAGTIGIVAANTLIETIVKEEEEVRLEEVYRILKESQQLISLNQQLKEQSEELETASQKLMRANQALHKADQRKNDFITTVTHEMRTPITAIRAFSEILFDNEDLDYEEKQHFLSTIIKETNRMERLINQVLDLEKYESG